MKTNLKSLAIIAFLGIFLHSCSSDDDATPALNAPEISDFEYGSGTDHSTDRVAYKGADIHLEATINAEATVSSITLVIHAHDVEPGEGEVEWDFEQVFTDANYLVINPTFHEHIDIPAAAPAGEYHIELLVTDVMGNSTEVEGHVQVLDPITISGFEMDESVVRGEDFHVEFMIDAVNGIHEVLVDVHGHDLPVGEGEEEWDFEGDFSEKYHELTEGEFHEHIDVPATAPVGEYHIIFTIEDEDGNTKEYETHIDVTA
ncbi:DUF4625 domain-containing protein [Kriegella aquimaris]|nr:DUF4625 domain-containing protein [Kriegella aquimaris]